MVSELLAGRSCLLPCSSIIVSPSLKRDHGCCCSQGKARHRPGVVLTHTLAALSSTDSRRDGRRQGTIPSSAQLGRVTEGAEGILRGSDREAAKSSSKDARGNGQPRDPCAWGLCPAQQGLGRCAVQGHLEAMLRSLVFLGDPAGASMTLDLQGASSGYQDWNSGLWPFHT